MTDPLSDDGPVPHGRSPRVPTSSSSQPDHTVGRRTVLRGVFGGAAGLIALAHVGTGAGSDVAAAERAEISREAAQQIAELARRIREGDARTLREGTVIIDGWHLPRDHVRRILRWHR